MFIADSELPEGIDREKWKAFCDHLAKDGKSSPLLENQHLARLRGMAARGVDCNAVLDEAVSGGWRSLREPIVSAWLDDDAVKKTIDTAKDGDESSAWALIVWIESALRKHEGAPALLEYAAEFFSALLDQRETEGAGGQRSGRDHYSGALNTLHITRERGQSKRPDDEETTLAARVQLLCGPALKVGKCKGISANAAYIALGDAQISSIPPLKEKYPAKAYRTAFDKARKRIEIAVRGELEGMAVSSLDTLLAVLLKNGGLTKAQADLVSRAWSGSFAK